MARFDCLREREAREPLLADGSLLLTHGRPTPKAFILIHGLTSSPPQVAAIAGRLHERGANVFIPLLPRHGYDRMSASLADLQPSELEAFATEIAAIGAGLGERRTVAGFSVGGLLCAWIAQHYAFERAVAIAPFLGTRWIPHRFAPHVARAALALPNAFFWWDPIARERLGPAHGYPRVATHAVAHVYALVFDLLDTAAHSAPATPEILFVLNASESTVHNRNVMRLARAWRRSSASVDFHVLRGLPPSHDIIEPLRAPRLARRVTPTLVDLIDR
jgi:carboxylesterase